MSFRTVVAFSASAALLATSANAEKLAKADVYINVLNCTDIRGSGDPYLYYKIDTSKLAGSSIARQTGIGNRVSGDDDDNLYKFPNSLQVWEKVKSPGLQTLETYLYDYDTLNPDDRLGKFMFKLKEIPNNCIAKTFSMVLNADDGTTCVFQGAICPVGSKPRVTTANTPTVTSTFVTNPTAG